MAIGIENQINIEPASAAYPSGDIKDRAGSTPGTPVNKKVYADLHQYFAKLLRTVGITANNTPDNEVNGNQYFQAFIDAINKYIGSDIILGLIGPYVTNDIIILWGEFREFPNEAAGSYGLTFGAAYYNGKIYQFIQGSPVGGIYLKIDNSSPQKMYASAISTGSIATLGDPNIKYLPGVPSYQDYSGNKLSIPPIQEKIIQLGFWNMQLTTSISIAHGISDRRKIISVTIYILDDDNIYTADLLQRNPNSTPPSSEGGSFLTQNTNINLSRVAGGLFDNASYNSLAVNRGYAYIKYML